MKKIVLSLFLAILFQSAFFHIGEAKSVSWNTLVNEDLLYYWNFGGRNIEGLSSGWQQGLENANVTVTYQADVYNVSAGNTLVSDGAVLPVGTQLRFAPKSFADSDISWFGTGYSADSPNGHWVSGANAPGSVSCNAQDYTGRASFSYRDPETGQNVTDQYDVYVPLSINPPNTSITHAGTAGLSCDASGQNCTINSAGSINTTFSFANTSGKFYYRYYDYRDGRIGNFEMTPGCYGNNTPMAASGNCTTRRENVCYDVPDCPGDGGGVRLEDNLDPNCDTYREVCRDVDVTECSFSPYEIQVPQKTISYALTAVGSGNTPPNPPVISGPAVGSANQYYPFGFQALDPDNDTIRYGIDWDRNSVVDQWLPGSGYVASNTYQQSGYSWFTEGAYTFQALTQDSRGAQSAWAPYTITLSGVVGGPQADLKINNSDGPISIGRGETLNLSWTSANVTSCSAWGTGWGSGGPVATTGVTSFAAQQSDTYIIYCTNGATTVMDSVQVVLTNSLKICQQSCSSGVVRGDTTSAGSFTLARTGTQDLVACFNTASDCSDSQGNVTASTTWTEGGGNYVSLSGTDPKTVTGDNIGSESVSASYSSQAASTNVTVTCVPTVTCDNAPGRENYCENQTFTVDNGCGTNITCNGTKTCNYNWKEVAP